MYLLHFIRVVKYSLPIEAGASFHPPNLAKDCILRASVSEAMGFFYEANPSRTPYGTVTLRTTSGNLYVYILATDIYVVKGKSALRADGNSSPTYRGRSLLAGGG